MEDEWITEIYGDLFGAKDAVVKWAEGAPFDNDRELQITRYFGKPVSDFTHGPELREGVPGICETEWMRYAEYEIRERSDDICRF